MIPESPYLKILRKSLQLCEEELKVISGQTDRAKIYRHILLLRASIKQIVDWDKLQERVRCGMENKI